MISLLIPTRKRPSNIKRILEELSPCLGDSLELIIGIDENDNSYDIDQILSYTNVKVIRSPNTPYLSNIYNILFEYTTGDIIGYSADDLTFQRLEVFDMIQKQMDQKGHILYYFCDNLQCGETNHSRCVPCHAFVTKESVRALGFLHVPNLEHGYADHYLGQLYKGVGKYHAEKTNLFYHLHPHTGSVASDETYEIKSHLKDTDGYTADERDEPKFKDFKHKYLSIHQNIISELNKV